MYNFIHGSKTIAIYTGNVTKIETNAPEPFDNRAAWGLMHNGHILYTGGSKSKRTRRIDPSYWSFKIMPDMLIERSTHALISYGKETYVFGGSGPLSKCEKQVCGHWEAVPDMLCAKSYVSAACSG